MSQVIRKYSYYLFSIFKLLSGFENPILVVLIFLKLPWPRIRKIRLRKSGMQFKVRGAMDVWSIKETFLDRFYEKFGYPVQQGWKIIDIGAGTGEYALFAAEKVQADGHVFAFEPFPESFALMQENLRLNHINNVQIFPKAVGAETGEMVLDQAGGEPLQFQSHQERSVDIDTGLQVNSLSLLGVFETTGLDSCDLLKLDCEGAEYAILPGAPRTTLECIKHIVMEYHDNVSGHDHHELVRLLSECGFEVDTFPNPVHSYLGYLRAMRKS